MSIEITGAQIAKVLKDDPASRPDLSEAINATFEDSTFEYNVPHLRVGSLALNGEPLAGPTLIPIPEWDGEVESLPEFLEQVRRHINRSRTGSE